MGTDTTGPKVEIITDPAIFAEQVDPVIRRDPVRCSVLATNLSAALHGFTVAQSRWILVEAGDVVLAGMITPPHPLWLTPVYGVPAGPVTELLAQALASAPDGVPGPGLPGVRGPIGSATPFARAWQRVTGRGHDVRMAQRMYELTELVEPTGITGSARPASEADRDLCVDWLHAFHAEAVPGDPVADFVRIVARRIPARGLALWTDGGRPVAMAGTSTVVAGVARIGPVYTPPQLRRHGYGAAVTAAATQAGFEAGATRCMLFTDLANPTSNALYSRLGYHPVGDAVAYAFVD
jgi:RimJ/RimL family protein N-acetyltransferase